jgi:ATP-binding cassette subfamily B protein
MRNIFALFKYAPKRNRSLFFWLLISALGDSLLPVLYIIMPRFILSELLGLQRVPVLAAYLAILCLGALILTILTAYTTNHTQYLVQKFIDSLSVTLAEKTLRIDYADSETKSVLDAQAHASYATDQFYNLRQVLVATGSALAGIVMTGALMISWQWWLILIVFGINLLTLPLLKRLREAEQDNTRRNMPENRAFSYFLELAVDFRYAKDLRLYNGVDMMMARSRNSLDKILKVNHEYYTRVGTLNGFVRVLTEAQTAVVFLILGIALMTDKLGISDFTMIYGASRQFGNAISGLFAQLRQMMTLNLEAVHFLNFMNLPERDLSDSKLSLSDLDENIQEALTLAKAGHVDLLVEKLSFKYPTAEQQVLDELNLHIQPGETVALVGRNGAGKSTLVKLLCRLYKPDSGRILLNGVDIWNIPIGFYYQILSVIFQDFELMPILLSENIASKKREWQDEDDTLRVRDALSRSDMLTWAEVLPEGIHNPITRMLSETGAVPSGGQEQKLAIARSVYHDGSLIIMDEPTSALDPRNEEQVFAQMLDITREQTAMFISHRLSSTRHADRIFVLDDGRLIAQGNHEQLMAEEGLYAQMFSAQAEQYQASSNH